MKLVRWELKELLNDYARAAGTRNSMYKMSGIDYWAGTALIAAMHADEPIGVQFFIGGYAIATPHYWPDMGKLSLQFLLDTDKKIACTYDRYYRQAISELHNSTRQL